MKRKSLINEACHNLVRLHCDLSDHDATRLVVALWGIIDTYQEVQNMEALKELLAGGIIDQKTFAVMAAQYERTMQFLEVNKLITTLQEADRK